jgi:hypothetical protein
VVGALAAAEPLRARGARPLLGGVSWERRPIDPEPGPRSEAEIEGARRLAPGVLLAGPATRVRASGVRFAEARMAAWLGEETVLVDATHGPETIAAGLRAAAVELGLDLIVFLDVGGDVLAHGDEPGLGSPLCDAVLLAAAARLQEAGARAVVGGVQEAGAGRVPEAGAPAVLGAVFGLGCDGELTPAEVFARLDELAAAGALGADPLGLDPASAARLEEAVEVVPTEASALPLRAWRGETGAVPIREGRRTVELVREAAATYLFDPAGALRSTSRLAAAVRDAGDLEQANRILNGLGVRTELDYEREMATSL